jgi:hypothetical protein
VNARSQMGRAPINMASFNNFPDIVQLLIEKGANVNNIVEGMLIIIIIIIIILIWNLSFLLIFCDLFSF